jgi:hypothetical protein
MLNRFLQFPQTILDNPVRVWIFEDCPFHAKSDILPSSTHSYSIKVVLCILVNAKKAIQHPAYFIFITARAGRKFLFPAALSDRAVHASYEKATLL